MARVKAWSDERGQKKFKRTLDDALKNLRTHVGYILNRTKVNLSNEPVRNFILTIGVFVFTTAAAYILIIENFLRNKVAPSAPAVHPMNNSQLAAVFIFIFILLSLYRLLLGYFDHRVLGEAVSKENIDKPFDVFGALIRINVREVIGKMSMFGGPLFGALIGTLSIYAQVNLSYTNITNNPYVCRERDCDNGDKKEINMRLDIDVSQEKDLSSGSRSNGAEIYCGMDNVMSPIHVDGNRGWIVEKFDEGKPDLIEGKSIKESGKVDVLIEKIIKKVADERHDIRGLLFIGSADKKHFSGGNPSLAQGRAEAVKGVMKSIYEKKSFSQNQNGRLLWLTLNSEVPGVRIVFEGTGFDAERAVQVCAFWPKKD